MKLEKFLLNSEIRKISKIIKSNLGGTFKPSKMMIQNVLNILRKRKYKDEDKVIYKELEDICEIYIMDEKSETDFIKFTQEIEQIIKEWYGDCPRSMAFVGKVIAAYRKHIGEIIIDDK